MFRAKIGRDVVCIHTVDSFPLELRRVVAVDAADGYEDLRPILGGFAVSAPSGCIVAGYVKIPVVRPCRVPRIANGLYIRRFTAYGGTVQLLLRDRGLR